MCKICFEQIKGVFMIQLVVCDLDETLLTSDKKITEKDNMAIQKARAKGVKFVCATGRGYSYIDDILMTLNVYNKENEYVISNNGAIITENKDNDELSFHKLSNTIAFQIIELGFRLKLCVQVFTSKDVYSFNTNEDEKKWLLMFKKDAILCKENNYDFLKDKEIVKVMYQHPDMNILFSLESKLNDEIKKNTTIAYSSNRYMEFTAVGISKGAALKELTTILNIPLKDTLAIGDNYNDISMIETAGIGTCVANANDDVKKACHYVSPFTHDENAVADILEKFVL